MLPSADLRQLELTRTGYVFVQPAVGEPEILMSYRGTIIWDGLPRPVRIIETDNDEPLLGMEFLHCAGALPPTGAHRHRCGQCAPIGGNALAEWLTPHRAPRIITPEHFGER